MRNNGTLIHPTMSGDGMDFYFLCSMELKNIPCIREEDAHVNTFLEKLTQMFETVILTASLSSYANQLIDILDPGNTLNLQYFFRDSCVSAYGNYVKDLTIIEVDHAKVAIVDKDLTTLLGSREYFERDSIATEGDHFLSLV